MAASPFIAGSTAPGPSTETVLVSVIAFDRVLYHTPGSCSRMVLNALEEIGLPYRERTVALHVGAHYAPDFRAINPKGKVPVLVEDGVAITELPVILYRLAGAHPDAALLPRGADGAIALAALSDLVWMAGALHPLAGRIFRPMAVSEIDADAVKAAAMLELGAQARMIAARIGGGWWYGDAWSIGDMFLAWVFGLGQQYGFPLDDHPVLVDHRARAEARASFVRARELEQAATVRDAIAMPPGFAL